MDTKYSDRVEMKMPQFSFVEIVKLINFMQISLRNIAQIFALIKNSLKSIDGQCLENITKKCIFFSKNLLNENSRQFLLPELAMKKIMPQNRTKLMFLYCLVLYQI